MVRTKYQVARQVYVSPAVKTSPQGAHATRHSAVGASRADTRRTRGNTEAVVCCPVFRCAGGGEILLTETQCVALPR